ncbi:ArsR family transcriptional regulator [Haloplanus salinus]|uniref:ArsR family transcriptional regulator n=1 Tax=Haloplanus salinus TaxID=1126245 RepID=A0A368NB33_9EURY|nr:helix-turn-helix domain-containing protein [Haloplanus salinus]RCU47738.1 ArsR family transcriptional regulator [Haloplanus salinus]
MSQERDESGRYQATVTLDAVLELFPDTEPRTTSEVAEALDVAQKTAYNKLESLRERGEIRKKKIGGLAVVWLRPDSPKG